MWYLCVRRCNKRKDNRLEKLESKCNDLIFDAMIEKTKSAEKARDRACNRYKRAVKK
jgi:hypothetical protein